MKDGSRHFYDFGHIFSRNRFADAELAERIHRQIDRLDAIHGIAKQKVAAVSSSANLTPSGKQEAVREIAKSLSEDIGAVESFHDSLKTRQARIEAATWPVRHSREDLAWQLECREIRDHIRQMDLIEQEAFVMSAAESGHEQILEAVEFAPIPFNFATQELIDKIREKRLLIQKPDEAAELTDARLASQEVHSALGSLKSALGALGVNIDGGALLRRQAA